ncbi:MAG: sigma-70 family RNA polymerase sigma factor [Planctomycetes bacterium]|nr:sigma-70 family RNA polymerase sigma factor [Planctomycetota bacterium]
MPGSKPESVPEESDGGKRIELLVQKALSGDSQAIDTLYRIYEKKLRSAIRNKLGRRLRGQVDSMDLIQSVWGDVLAELNQFSYNGPDSFFSWLIVRMVHKIQTKARYLTAGKRNPDKLEAIAGNESVEEDRVQPLRENKTPSQMAINKERMEKFSMILDHFPKINRQVLVLRIRDELDFLNIGKRIGKSEDAARMLYSRSLKKLVDGMLEKTNG